MTFHGSCGTMTSIYIQILLVCLKHTTYSMFTLCGCGLAPDVGYLSHMCWKSQNQPITFHLHGSNRLVNPLIYGCNKKLHFESRNNNSTGTQVTAYTNSTSLTYPTIRHSLCELLLAEESKWEGCQQCILSLARVRCANVI